MHSIEAKGIVKSFLIALIGGAVLGLLAGIVSQGRAISSRGNTESRDFPAHEVQHAAGHQQLSESILLDRTKTIDALRAISRLTESSLHSELSNLLATNAFSPDATRAAGYMLNRLIAINPESAYRWLSLNNFAFASHALLRTLFTEWGKRDFTRFQSTLPRISSKPVKESALSANLSRMMADDPKRALQTIRELEGADELELHAYLFWARLDPIAAFQNVAAEGEAENQDVLSAVIREVSESSLEMATALLSEISSTSVSDELTSDLSLKIASQNIQGALRIIDGIRDPRFRGATLWSAYSSLSSVEPSKAISLLEQLPDSPLKWDTIGRATTFLADSPEDFSKLLAELPSTHYRQQVLEVYLREVDLTDPSALLGWAATLPHPTLAREAVSGVMRKGAQAWNMETARRYVMELPVALRNSAARSWVERKGSSPDPGYSAEQFADFLSSVE